MNENIKKEKDIIEDYLKKYQYYINKDIMPPEIEKEVTEKANTLWIKVDEVLLDLESWLEADEYDELYQCVKDFISELKEKEHEIKSNK